MRMFVGRDLKWAIERKAKANKPNAPKPCVAIKQPLNKSIHPSGPTNNNRRLKLGQKAMQ